MKKLVITFLVVLISCSKEEPLNVSPTEQPKYVLTVNAEEGGTVNTAGGTYSQGQTVSIQAIPNSGYEFSGWSGNASGNSF